MTPLDRSQVRTGAAYESVRQATQQALATTQSERRVDLGADLALVFESRDTLRAAVEETLRAERVSDDDAVLADVEAFSGLVPQASELLATLYLDLADPAALADRLPQVQELGSVLALDVDGRRAPGRPRAGADLQAGALLLAFALDDGQRRAWLSGGPVSVVIDHGAPALRVDLDDATRAAVATDLGEG